MAIDTPAKLAIIGAGPIGLETALYARFLGYDVDLFERGRVADCVLRWGHVRMFTPFCKSHSTLGLAALMAQDTSWQPPGDGTLLTGREWVEQYLLPLSQSDLLIDAIHEKSEVVAVGRDGILRDELAGLEERGDPDFRLLVRDSEGERFVTADAVIDTGGVASRPNWLGPGGLPAIGELENRERIEYGWPDILGRDRDRYAGQRVLVVGSGHSAATTVVELANLAANASGTKITWITHCEPSAGDGEPDGEQTNSKGPIPQFDDDPFPARRELAEVANQFAAGGNPFVTHWPGAFVERIRWKDDADRFSLRLARAPEEKLKVEQIIAQVGHRPDWRVCSELQVHPNSVLSRHPVGVNQPEPDFYVLGAKSGTQHSPFLFADGLAQIRALFALLGDRPEMDLYSTVGGVRLR